MGKHLGRFKDENKWKHSNFDVITKLYHSHLATENNKTFKLKNNCFVILYLALCYRHWDIS
jgi:hypothetical protein